jgi:tight adherence protein B
VVKTLIVMALGLGIAVGISGLIWALRSDGASLRGQSRIGEVRGLPKRARRAAVPTAVGLLLLALTRWPVAGVLGALACATLPGSLRRVAPGTSSKRSEAVAGWTELIRDSLAASSGLAQAIVVTAPSAPIPIRPQVGALATRLTNGASLEAALRSFAVDVEDPAAEFLVCALLLAATSHSQRLVEVLGALTESIREDVAMHLRVDASRASALASVRTVVLFSIAFAGTLTVIARSYLSPFGSATGQLVLSIVGLFYAAGLFLMVRLVRPVPEMRLFDAEQVA